MSAENNLYLDMVECFDKIGACEISTDINFIILFDGMKNDIYTKPGLEFPCVYEMKKGTTYLTAMPVKNFGKEYDDLTEKGKLEDILDYIKKKYAADNYGYIYSGHGGAGEGDISSGFYYTKLDRILPEERDKNGDIKEDELEERLTMPGWSYQGYCESNDPAQKDIILVVYARSNNKSLTYKGLNAVLLSVFKQKGLAFLFLDTCWGMMIENGYTFKDLTDYYVATPDEMPSSGVGYASLINLLNNWPQIKPAELGKLLVAVNYANNYADYAKGREEFRKMGVSLTCTTSTTLDDIIANYFDPFCSHIIANIQSLFFILKKAAEQCKDYTYENYAAPEYTDYEIYNIDLIWLLENILYFNYDQRLNKIRDTRLHVLTHELLQKTSLYLIKGFMANNYEECELGDKPCIGGKGIAITLPKNKAELQKSIYKPGATTNFVNKTKWREVLIAYTNNIDKQIKFFDSKDITEAFEKEINKYKNSSFSSLFFEDTDNKSSLDFLTEYVEFLYSARDLNVEKKWSSIRLRKPE